MRKGNNLSKSKLSKTMTLTEFENGYCNGKIVMPKKIRRSKNSEKDYQIGLSLKLPVINYTSNKITKNFIKTEAKRMENSLVEKSGVWYRLNRWRDNKLNNGIRITYGDLIQEYIRLNQIKEGFERIPQGRYINYLSDYLKNEKEATREEAIAEWHKLKTMDIPKTYTAWKNKVNIK